MPELQVEYRKELTPENFRDYVKNNGKRSDICPYIRFLSEALKIKLSEDMVNILTEENMIYCLKLMEELELPTNPTCIMKMDYHFDKDNNLRIICPRRNTEIGKVSLENITAEDPETRNLDGTIKNDAPLAPLVGGEALGQRFDDDE